MIDRKIAGAIYTAWVSVVVIIIVIIALVIVFFVAVISRLIHRYT